MNTERMCRLGFAPRAMTVAIAVLCLAWASTARAQSGTPAGELELIRGKAKITRPSNTLVVDGTGTRHAVFVGDVVHTGADSRATIHMASSANSVNLYAATYFTVEETTPRRTGFAVALGKALFNLVRGTEDERQYNVRTPTATVGVKGTEFYVGTDGETTYLLTVTGVVGMVNNAFAQREVIAEAARASAARPREVPTPTVRVSPESLQRLQTEDGLQAFKDLPIRSESERRQRSAQGQVESGLESLRNTSEELREAAGTDASGFRYRFDFQ